MPPKFNVPSRKRASAYLIRIAIGLAITAFVIRLLVEATPTAVFEFQSRSTSGGVAELFIDTGAGFTEEAKTRFQILDEVTQIHSIPIHDYPIKNLRLDFIDRPTRLLISDTRLRFPDTIQPLAFPATAWRPRSNTDYDFALQNNEIRVSVPPNIWDPGMVLDSEEFPHIAHLSAFQPSGLPVFLRSVERYFPPPSTVVLVISLVGVAGLIHPIQKTHTQLNHPPRDPGWTAVRWLAVLIILYNHATQVSVGLRWSPIGQYLFFPKGTFGNYLFFSVSGALLIPRLLLESNQSSFLKRRIIAIYPQLVIALLFFYLWAFPVLAVSGPIHFLSETETWTGFFGNVSGLVPNLYIKGLSGHGFILGPLWILPYFLVCYSILVILERLKVLQLKAIIFIFLALIALYVINLYREDPSNFVFAPHLDLEKLFTHATAFFGAGILSLYFPNLKPKIKSLPFALVALLSVLLIPKDLAMLEPLRVSMIALFAVTAAQSWPARISPPVSGPYSVYLFAYPLLCILKMGFNWTSALGTGILAIFVSFGIGRLVDIYVQPRFRR